MGFEEELLDLLVGEAIEPVMKLGELVVGEVGEFGWKRLFSHKMSGWWFAKIFLFKLESVRTR